MEVEEAVVVEAAEGEREVEGKGEGKESESESQAQYFKLWQRRFSVLTICFEKDMALEVRTLLTLTLTPESTTHLVAVAGSEVRWTPVGDRVATACRRRLWGRRRAWSWGR